MQWKCMEVHRNVEFAGRVELSLQAEEDGAQMKMWIVHRKSVFYSLLTAKLVCIMIVIMRGNAWYVLIIVRQFHYLLKPTS